MRARIAVVGSCGVLATFLGILLLVRPDLLLGISPIGRLVDLLSTPNAETLGLVAGGFAVLYLIIAARSEPVGDTVQGGTKIDRKLDLAATPPEADATTGRSIVAASLDEDIAEAADSGGDAFREIRSRLSSTATIVYADRAGTSRETAREAVGTGEWTSDPVAAAFLADRDEVTPSTAMRLRHWLVPVRERKRRIERTIEAIEQAQDHT